MSSVANSLRLMTCFLVAAIGRTFCFALVLVYYMYLSKGVHGVLSLVTVVLMVLQPPKHHRHHPRTAHPPLASPLSPVKASRRRSPEGERATNCRELAIDLFKTISVILRGAHVIWISSDS